ncbi:MAG: hypothetical protein ACTSWA_12165, partial [Candidatus Thorarchaeota archaeon]
VHLFLSLLNKNNLSCEILGDLEYLFLGNPAVKLEEVGDLSLEMLQNTMANDESVIPDSIRRIVTIYLVVMWFATVLVLIMGLG